MPHGLIQKSGMEMNSAWNAWKNIFLNIIVDNYAPKRVMRVRNKPAPWLKSQLKEKEYELDSLKCFRNAAAR